MARLKQLKEVNLPHSLVRLRRKFVVWFARLMQQKQAEAEEAKQLEAEAQAQISESETSCHGPLVNANDFQLQSGVSVSDLSGQGGNEDDQTQTQSRLNYAGVRVMEMNDLTAQDTTPKPITTSSGETIAPELVAAVADAIKNNGASSGGDPDDCFD